MKMPKIIKVLLLVFVLKQLFWAFITPPGTGPDEIGHLSYINHIYEHSEFPELGEAKLYEGKVASEHLNWIAQHPPLYYAFLEPFYAVFRLQESIDPLFLLRIFSIFFGVLILSGAYKILEFTSLKFSSIFSPSLKQSLKRPNSKNIRETNYFTLAVLTAIAFHPMFAHLSSVVNNDNLLIAISTWLIYFLLRYNEVSTTRNIFYIALLLGLGLLTKSTVLPLFIVVILVLLFSSFFKIAQDKSFDLKLQLKHLLLIIFIPLLISGWWYVQNFLIFKTFAPELKNVSPVILAQDPKLMLMFPEINPLSKPIYSFEQFFFKDNFFIEFYKNFWGTFGNLKNQLLDWQYILIFILSGGSLFGLVSNYRKTTKTSVMKPVHRLFTLTLLIVFFAISFKIFQISSTRGFLGAAQGRYLFIAIAPFFYFFVLGLQNLLTFFFSAFHGNIGSNTLIKGKSSLKMQLGLKIEKSQKTLALSLMLIFIFNEFVSLFYVFINRVH